jgi:hypothetical protein
MIALFTVVAALAGGPPGEDASGDLLLPRSLVAAEDWNLLFEEAAEDQVVNPANAQQDKGVPNKMTEREQVVVVKGTVYSEEDRVGPYKQPEWTQHRRWPVTRVYIQQPPGAVEFEQWLEVRIPKGGGKNNETRLRQEFEFGLGHRLQLDLYAHSVYKQRQNTEGPDTNTLDWRGWSAELRYALADYDEIFGNPTLYFEYIVFNGDGESIEPKLLLGGEVAPGWHWGVNLVYERELQGLRDRTEEFKITIGFSHTIIDKVLSIGIGGETAYEIEHEDSTRGERSREIHLGPSLQYRPVPKAHIDIEPMWGLTGESKRLKMFLVFGWDF